jgi:hypothetical protein
VQTFTRQLTVEALVVAVLTGAGRLDVRGRVLEHRLQRSHQPLACAAVCSLAAMPSLGRIELHTAVDLASAVITLLRDRDVLAGLRESLAVVVITSICPRGTICSAVYVDFLGVSSSYPGGDILHQLGSERAGQASTAGNRCRTIIGYR